MFTQTNLFFFFKLNSLSCFEAKKLEPYRDATVVWQGNWLPRIPLSSSSPSKEDAKWKQKSPNEAWMIKEARGERLSNCRHYTFFLLFVSSSVHFQLRAADGVKGREVLHHRGIINMKETRQIKKKKIKKKGFVSPWWACKMLQSRIQCLLTIETYLKGKWPSLIWTKHKIFTFYYRPLDPFIKPLHTLSHH